MPDTYRRAASILLLRNAQKPGGRYELLLVHKPRKRDSWQLPQGGVEEGETFEQCALRELSEEAGINAGVRIVGVSKHVYQYEFPESYRRFRPDHVCGQRISFVLAFADAPLRITVDGEEIDRSAWVLPRDLQHFIERSEYLALIRSLVAEDEDLLAA